MTLSWSRFLHTFVCLLILDLLWVTRVLSVSAFQTISVLVPRNGCLSPIIILQAAKSDSNKKRRRKIPTTPQHDQNIISQELKIGSNESTPMTRNRNEGETNVLLQESNMVEIPTLPEASESITSKTDLKILTDIPTSITKGIQDAEVTTTNESADTSASVSIPLPDITEVRKKKRMEQELKRLEEDNEVEKVKINRNDRKALLKVRTCSLVCFY